MAATNTTPKSQRKKALTTPSNKRYETFANFRAGSLVI
jgi:hypothetical protein